MKQNTPPSNSDTVLPTAQWLQYAENASRFAAEWEHEMDEKGEAHSFWDEFLQIFNIRWRQFAWHEARADKRRGKLNKLRFLDPACGCGNFLVVTYRELNYYYQVFADSIRGIQSIFSYSYLNPIFEL